MIMEVSKKMKPKFGIASFITFTSWDWFKILDKANNILIGKV